MSRLVFALLALAFPAAASAGADCQTVYATSDDVITAAGPGGGSKMSLDGLEIQALEPVAIDLTSVCAPTLVLEGLQIQPLRPEEIDLAAAVDLTVEGEAQTKEHIILARQPPGGLKTIGGLIWAPTSMSLREEVISWRPYASVVVADITFELVGVELDLSEGTPVYAYVEGVLQLSGGVVLDPDPPICSQCN